MKTLTILRLAFYTIEFLVLTCAFGCGRGPTAPALGVWDSVEGDFSLEFSGALLSDGPERKNGWVYLYTTGRPWSGTFYLSDEPNVQTHGFAGFKDKNDKSVMSFEFGILSEDMNRMRIVHSDDKRSTLWKRPTGGSTYRQEVPKTGTASKYDAERNGGSYIWKVGTIEGELKGSRLIASDGSEYLIRRLGDCKEYDSEGNVVGLGQARTSFNMPEGKYHCVGFCRASHELFIEYRVLKKNSPNMRVFDVVEIRPSDMRPPSSQITFKVISQEWTGIEAGTKVTAVGGNEGEITEDLASLKIRIEVFNASSRTQRVGSIFQLATFTGAAQGVPVIDYALTTNRNVREISLHPGGRQILELASDMMNYGKLANAQPLMTVHPQIRDWSTHAPKLPSKEVLFNPSADTNTIQISLLRQEWQAMKAGTKVRVSEGDERVVSADLAALQITVELKNLSSWSEQVDAAFLLTDDGYTPIQRFTLRDSEKDSKSNPDGIVQLKPGETKTLQLQTSFTGFDKLSATTPTRIVYSKTREWRAAALPNREVLLKSKETP